MRSSRRGLHEDRCQWRGARTSPVTARKHLGEDLLFAALLHSGSRKAKVLRAGEEGAVDRCGKDVSSVGRAVNRAVRARRGECRCRWEVSVTLSVQRPQALRFLLQNDGGLVVLRAWRRCWREHGLRNVLRNLRVVVHGCRRAGRVWSLLVHVLRVVGHHVLGARRNDSHGQTVWVRREVAVLPVLRARVRVVVEERRLSHRRGAVRSVLHCIDGRIC